MALSAFFSPTAAALEAKVSGKDVPRATNVIAKMFNGDYSSFLYNFDYASPSINAASIHKKDILLPVTLGFNPTRHPNMLARSPTIAVNNPIIPRDTKKHGHPPHIPAGGINAKMI